MDGTLFLILSAITAVTMHFYFLGYERTGVTLSTACCNLIYQKA